MKKDQIFQIQLTKEQRAFISLLLPKAISLQSVANENHKTVGRPSLKNKSPQMSEDCMKVRESSEQKRRRGRVSDEQNELERKNTLGKKQQISRCFQILKKLKKHGSAWPFKSPVNTKQLSIPDYFKIVLNPIDLQTIENNFKQDLYEHPSQFQRDVNQMFLNSYKFNPKNDTYFYRTMELEEYYNQLIKESHIEPQRKKLPQRNKKKEDLNHRHPDGEKTTELGEMQKEITLLLKKSAQFIGHKYEKQKTNNYSTRIETPMNIQEKRELGYEIRSLTPRHIERVAEIIIKNKTKNQGNHNHNSLNNGNILEEDSFGVDLDKMDLKTLREVQNYIRQVKKKPEEYSVKQEIESKEFGMQVE